MVIIARGDHIRHFTIRPWMMAFIGSALAAIAIGYLLATTYLVLRDDLIGATVARQARVQQAYEDRISALRSQVDRITSRQLLDQQLMESKVTELLERQAVLTRRHGRLDPIMNRADGETVLPASTPVPESRPDRRADASSAAEKVARLPTIRPGPKATHSALGFAPERMGDEMNPISSADEADRLFLAINQSLRAIEVEQLDRMQSLAQDADRRANTIANALETVGLAPDSESSETGIGGPFIAVDESALFESRVRELDDALSRLDLMKRTADVVPIHNPAPGYSVSSSFGVRRDPFLRRPAMHAGIDFRVPQGGPIRAGGAGKVVTAGWNGGYGRMVEIEHEDGLTTRYAHMSRIVVKVGEEVERGQIIGRSGSSGRSTGPHLHYEVRRNGKAIDPLGFIKAGKQISDMM